MRKSDHWSDFAHDSHRDMSILGFSRKEMDLRSIDTDRIKDSIPCAYPSLKKKGSYCVII
jgi:hypothetical protein